MTGVLLEQHLTLDPAIQDLAVQRSLGVAALRLAGVRRGLVLDEASVVREGAGHFTGYVYPAGRVPQ